MLKPLTLLCEYPLHFKASFKSQTQSQDILSSVLQIHWCYQAVETLNSCQSLSKLQHIVMKKIAEDCGYLNPYVPESLVAEIQCRQAQWIDTAIGDYLKISAQCDVKKWSYRNAGRYTTILQTCDYGRHIYPDCVIIRRHNQADLRHYITTIGSSGKPIQLPDPHYYWWCHKLLLYSSQNGTQLCCSV